MHAITGLPRSGSTLLCNILNQNPRFWGSSTSPLPGSLAAWTGWLSNNMEFKSDLISNQFATEDWVQDTARFMCLSKYRDQAKAGRCVLFDKSRGWTHHFLTLRQLFPKSKIIVMVRDLRSVYASIERMHQRFPMLSMAQSTLDGGLYETADRMFKVDGIIGHAIHGMLDMYRRGVDVHVVQFADLVQKPEKTIAKLYEYLEEETFPHDLENIENTATDVDGLYLNKFPHATGKKIAPPEYHWSDFVSDDVASQIVRRFDTFNRMYKMPVE